MSKPKNNKLIPAKIIKKVTGKIAALSCGAASIWGLKQPKEPPNSKALKFVR